MNDLPDCRDKYLDSKFTNISDPGKKEKNPYWDGYVEGDDEIFLSGYDTAHIKGVWNFFANLDLYEEVLKRATGMRSIKTNNKIMSDERVFSEFSDFEIERMDPATRLFKAIQDCMMEYLETERNMLIKDMLDKMDEDKYQQIVKKRAMEEE